MKQAILNNYKGVLLASAIALVGIVLGNFTPFMSKTLSALAIGVIIGNFVNIPKYFSTGLKLAEKQILEYSIVLIGFGFQLSMLQDLGVTTFAAIVISVVFVIAFSMVLGKKMGCSQSLSILLGAGSAICGSAAIAATAPLIKAKEEETGLSLGIINFLGLIGVVTFPLISMFFDFDDMEAGILIGGVLQSLGHVMASAYTLGQDAGDYAAIVKMARILLMLPLLIVFYFLGRKSSQSSKSTKTKVAFPYFILFFAGTVIVSQLNWLSPSTTTSLANAGDILLCVSMAAIGLKIRIKEMIQISGKASLHGTIVFLVHIAFFLALIYFF